MKIAEFDRVWVEQTHVCPNEWAVEELGRSLVNPAFVVRVDEHKEYALPVGYTRIWQPSPHGAVDIIVRGGFDEVVDKLKGDACG